MATTNSVKLLFEQVFTVAILHERTLSEAWYGFYIRLPP